MRFSSKTGWKKRFGSTTVRRVLGGINSKFAPIYNNVYNTPCLYHIMITKMNHLGQLQTQVSEVLHGSYIWDLLTACSAGVQNEPVSYYAIHHDNPYTFLFSTRTKQIICFGIKLLEIARLIFLFFLFNECLLTSLLV